MSDDMFRIADGFTVAEIEALCAAYGHTVRIEEPTPGVVHIHFDDEAALRTLADHHKDGPAVAHAALDHYFAQHPEEETP
ncbi:hypothetical protein [Streptomyces sp. NPDC051219]|uniref:hypothetical protein n=1 Tax=Streptomyces sp. NPDC051219 TaxID=3155283 RepID=UPI00342D3A20